LVLTFRQLLGEGGPIEVGDLLGSLRLGDQAPEDRPHLIANFVASVDGRATFQCAAESRPPGLSSTGETIRPRSS